MHHVSPRIGRVFPAGPHGIVSVKLMPHPHFLLVDRLTNPISTLVWLWYGLESMYCIGFAYLGLALRGKPDLSPYRHHDIIMRLRPLYTLVRGSPPSGSTILTRCIHSLHHLLTVIVDVGLPSTIVVTVHASGTS